MALRQLSKAPHRRKHPELLELYQEQRWLPQVLQVLLKKDSRCIDVGAHIGSFLSLMLRFAPLGRHCAFEASPTKCKWLRKRFPEVQVFEYAVAAERGRAQFIEEYAQSGYSRLTSPNDSAAAGSHTYEVEVQCLDDVITDKTAYDLIKIDIEGAELAALRGAKSLIKSSQPAIIFECGPEKLDRQNSSDRKDLYDFITGKLGYEILSFSDFLFKKGPMHYDEFRRCGIYPFRALNFLALPSDTIQR